MKSLVFCEGAFEPAVGVKVPSDSSQIAAARSAHRIVAASSGRMATCLMKAGRDAFVVHPGLYERFERCVDRSRRRLARALERLASSGELPSCLSFDLLNVLATAAEAAVSDFSDALACE